ncbi:MBL fold metallo-hydrolase [Bacillus spizizenii]|nr:MBL fold metallo-hydrolase [Bacillus spizizenii]MCY7959696.1 MBL fold metallo-hydrolase [Bacillus spizizenii]MCY7990088.1 MBL fold metallo-hydrolase [Bacillus spizizenii]MCY7996607.1 MBL fold metallo-hydrolase [Bacillus spizizenii]MCY8051430.1 MBL fold metallo-hydrolase [Bacillus spizizenii]
MTFFPAFFPVNCYLVDEENEVTLVDAALPGSCKGIIQAVNQLGKLLHHILLTHAHGDHVGSLDALTQAIPHAKVMISERDSFLLKGDTFLRHDEPQTPIKGGIPKHVQIKPHHLLTGGETIGSLLAISTPGHTPGSMSFLDTRNGTIIAGDAFQLRGGIAVSGQIKWAFPFPEFDTWNKEEAIKSAQLLADKAPSSLAVGHGNFLRSPTERMRQAIQKAKKG